jgi:hypothetical protein
MMARVLVVLMLNFGYLLAPWNTLMAQEIAINQARAVVLPGISVIGTHDLDFGTITPGANKTVDKIEASSAGEWIIIGTPDAEIDITFNLPTALTSADGSDALPIEFKIADASFSNNIDDGQQLPAGIIDPHQLNTLQIGSNGALGIWLGGEVYSDPLQVNGLYTGQITLTVAYTGN